MCTHNCPFVFSILTGAKFSFHQLLHKLWSVYIVTHYNVVKEGQAQVLSLSTLLLKMGRVCLIRCDYYFIIPFMQGIHTYIPETNHVCRVYSVAVILRMLLMVHIALSSLLSAVVLLH
jgi:hypothetical protein